MKYLLILLVLSAAACSNDPKFFLGQMVVIKEGFYKGCYLVINDYDILSSNYKGEIISCPYTERKGFGLSAISRILSRIYSRST